EAAEAVCGEAGVGCSVLGVGSEPGPLTPNTEHPTSSLEYLEELRACSLVMVEETGVQRSSRSGSTSDEHEHEHEKRPEHLNTRMPEPLNPGIRFRMLEALREYGAEQLGTEEREELGRRHVRYFLALAEEADRRLRGAEMEPWLARLKAEQDNMRAALAWALAHQEAETALR